MLTPFLLHTRYTEQSMNCFEIGCFHFEERLGLHIVFAQAAHNHRKPSERFRVISGRAVAANRRRLAVGLFSVLIVSADWFLLLVSKLQNQSTS